MPILHGFQPIAAPPLTDHMRAHVVAQYRADLRRAEAELRTLPPARSFRQQARYLHLSTRASTLRADLAALADDLRPEGQH